MLKYFASRRKILSLTRAAAALIVLAGCSDRVTESMENRTYNDLLSRVNAAKTQLLTVEASRELEGRIVDELARGLPVGTGVELRKALNADAIDIQLDPKAPKTEEAQRRRALVNAFLDLRKQRADTDRQAISARLPNTEGKVQVKVAIVQELKDATAQAMIYRRPDDNGVPVVVLREASITARDIQSALPAAARSIATQGASVVRERWISLHRHSVSSPSSSQPKATFQTIVEMVQAQPAENIPGIGEGRMIRVWTSPPPTLPRRPNTAR